PSPRAVALDQARAIIDALPPFVTVAALFLDPGRGAVEAALKALPIDLLQFHGDEPAAFCESFERPYIKALPMADDVDLNAAAREYRHARALLLDAHARGEPGGQGKTFDWRRLELPLPVVLAGGLGPHNVAGAIETVRPWAVDVSSGVESAAGVKSEERMAAFVNEVDRAAS
ncbi:MAG TPA: phosphoribosylanthranilate isomerase, partial [Gammaproteobacteria bacterium]|nr:phosphoribosylanthranilate isomerase [Gammaproteobacteria bacterium]